jgi:hypothetical protein
MDIFIKFLESYEKLPDDWQEKYQFIIEATVSSLKNKPF